MKKILTVFLACMAVLFITFMITNKSIDIDIITDNVKTFFSDITGKEKINYSNEFKINNLQLKKADLNFNRLNDRQKEIYTQIAIATKELNETIRFDNYLGDDIEKISSDVKIVITAFFADHPEIFYLNSTYNLSLSKTILYDKIQLKLTYSVKNKSELEEKLNELTDIINKYTENLTVGNDFDNEVYLHDKLAKEVKYYDEIAELDNIPEEYHNIYGTLTKKASVCDGFTKTLQLLLEKVGIESQFVTGSINDEPHAWNLVKLDDNWYHVDLTSNKYVKDEDEKNIVVAHTYFNVNDDFILKTHKIDNKELLPKCYKTDYNFYVKKGYHVSSTDNFNNKIEEIIKKQSDNNCLEFAADGISDVPNKLLNALYSLNFNNYKNVGKNVKMKYYNEQNTFIVKKTI